MVVTPEDIACTTRAMNTLNVKGGGSPGSDGSYEIVESTRGHSQRTISVDAAAQWERELLAQPKNRLASAALSQHGKDILTQRATQIRDTQHFNVKVATEGGPIVNQRATGRCWLFAATNCFRVALMKRYNLKELELSTGYLFYWDKLEKANWYLEQIINTADEPLDGRLLQTLMADPLGDGGQWDMLANLVEKYGLVPLSVYPDTFSSQNSSGMRTLMTTKLRENALELRNLISNKNEYLKKDALATVKTQMLREMHAILTIMLGPPPSVHTKFQWEFYDKDDKFHSIEATPLDLSAELASEATVAASKGVDIQQNFSLVNDPRNKYGTLLSVSRLGNCVGMRPVRYVNVDMLSMKMAAIAMLKADVPVFFGSDVGKFSNKTSGIMDVDLIDYELGFNIKLGLSKAQRLMTGESSMTHAMVLTAVHLDANGKPVRWRVQNSWGEGVGSKGWFVMSDSWMDEFVYQIVVDPKFVSSEMYDVLKQKPTMLELWDPMGALA